MALNMVVETFTNPGDGIVLHTPAYTALQNAIEKYDRKMIESSLVLENGRYRMDFKQLREALDDNLKKESIQVLCCCAIHIIQPGVYGTKESLMKLHQSVRIII